MIYYKCKSPAKGKNPVLESHSRISKKMNSYRDDIKREIENHLNDVKNEYMGINFIGSFIQAGRTKNVTKNAVKKMNEDKNSILSGLFGFLGSSNKKSSKPQKLDPIVKKDFKNVNLRESE